MRSSVVAVFVAVLASASLMARVSLAEDKPAAAAAEKPAKGTIGKAVTLKGTMTCGKCALAETEKCQNVLKVGKAGQEVKYYLAANDLAEKNHEQVCGGEAKATVKGTVAEEAGKKVLTATSIKYQ